MDELESKRIDRCVYTRMHFCVVRISTKANIAYFHMYENRNPSFELIFLYFVYIKTNNSKSFYFFSLCKYERFSILPPKTQRLCCAVLSRINRGVMHIHTHIHISTGYTVFIACAYVKKEELKKVERTSHLNRFM